jgi:hypothetical protein
MTAVALITVRTAAVKELERPMLDADWFKQCFDGEPVVGLARDILADE